MLTVKVVGAGCPRCQELERMCLNTAAQLNLDADIQKITDVDKFAELGIVFTPALIINDKVFCSGKLPAPHTLKNWMLMNNI